MNRQDLIVRVKGVLASTLVGDTATLADRQKIVLEIFDRDGALPKGFISARFLREVIGFGSLTSHSEFLKKSFGKGPGFPKKLECFDQRAVVHMVDLSDQDCTVRSQEIDTRWISLMESRMASIELGLEKLLVNKDRERTRANDVDLVARDSSIKEEVLGFLKNDLLKILREDLVEPIDKKIGDLQKALEGVTYFKGLAAMEVDRVRQLESALRGKISEERMKCRELEYQAVELKKQISSLNNMLAANTSQIKQ